MSESGGGARPAETVSATFRRILATTDLPPITLRDLRHVAEKAAKLIPRSRPAAADSSAQAAPDPQATSASAHASLTQWLQNEAAPDPTEADSGAA
ncbi:hypothetical protein [Streptomyces neyagawaensis]|uniref:hypothetical protein n=1 Tax=Streptomyces neyagawaensis TaxID=42238 RepID=UPI000A428185|nr:hypothetical protein [Streptomyces neyagawaensis]MCL6738077.1 hypothetical protein [Streptomyces neyagawaensis]MDE1681779.1 hypothetical protein [Streptomyces neyagawaensis]